MNLSLPAHVAHRALLCALGFSVLSEPSSTCLSGCTDWRSIASPHCTSSDLSQFHWRSFPEQSRGRLCHADKICGVRCPASDLWIQEDEAMLRGNLKGTGRTPFAEKHARIAFTLEVRILRTKVSMSWRVTIFHADMRVTYHPHGHAETGCLTLIEET